MRTFTIAPTLARSLANTNADVSGIIRAIDHIVERDGDVQSEELITGRFRRVYANGHRVLYRETTTEITILTVRPSVRRRWENLLT